MVPATRMLSTIPRATEVDERFPGTKELQDTTDNINQPLPKKEGVIRVWVDGYVLLPPHPPIFLPPSIRTHYPPPHRCFDMHHFGHANAIRQAALLGHELYVGIHTDEEVMRFKGPPIMNAQERYAAARACKWVSRVIEGVPYVTDVADIEKYEIDFVVHGDDLSTDLNGNNSYQSIIDIGKFKIVKRTEGISTTDLVGRMLLVTKNHHDADHEKEENPLTDSADKSFHQDVTYSRYASAPPPPPLPPPPSVLCVG